MEWMGAVGEALTWAPAPNQRAAGLDPSRPSFEQVGVCAEVPRALIGLSNFSAGVFVEKRRKKSARLEGCVFFRVSDHLGAVGPSYAASPGPQTSYQSHIIMEKQDIFRDTWIRYTAFASELLGAGDPVPEASPPSPPALLPALSPFQATLAKLSARFWARASIWAGERSLPRHPPAAASPHCFI